MNANNNLSIYKTQKTAIQIRCTPLYSTLTLSFVLNYRPGYPPPPLYFLTVLIRHVFVI